MGALSVITTSNKNQIMFSYCWKESEFTSFGVYSGNIYHYIVPFMLAVCRNYLDLA